MNENEIFRDLVKSVIQERIDKPSEYDFEFIIRHINNDETPNIETVTVNYVRSGFFSLGKLIVNIKIKVTDYLYNNRKRMFEENQKKTIEIEYTDRELVKMFNLALENAKEVRLENELNTKLENLKMYKKAVKNTKL